jgi:hypothetical protein
VALQEKCRWPTIFAAQQSTSPETPFIVRKPKGNTPMRHLHWCDVKPVLKIFLPRFEQLGRFCRSL